MNKRSVDRSFFLSYIIEECTITLCFVMKEYVNNTITGQSPPSSEYPVSRIPSKHPGLKRLFRNVLRFLFRIIFYPLCGIKSPDNKKIV